METSRTLIWSVKKRSLLMNFGESVCGTKLPFKDFLLNIPVKANKVKNTNATKNIL